MKRKDFIILTGTTLLVGGVLYYLSSDKSNFTRTDIKEGTSEKSPLNIDERAILYLASLAPSGHNTQPWFVQYLAPYHWIIGNDSTKWLAGVDPTQRETLLSIGAFMQNLEYAASHFGYDCQFTLLAKANQDQHVAELKLTKTNQSFKYDVQKMIQRRTVRSNYLNAPLTKQDFDFLKNNEEDAIHYIPNTAKEHIWLNEQTIEANRLQAYRDNAERELANWIRFSSIDAKTHCDGLTLASMEISGIPAWYLRNFYGKNNVMKKGFRDKSIDSAAKQVSASAGWLLITSKDQSVNTLLETGKRLQRLLLKIRERNIAIHPMTQILEEATTWQTLHSSLGMNDPIQFILRVGYLNNYPEPVSLRRPVNWFVRK